MTTTTTITMDDSVKALLTSDYWEAADQVRTYDVLAGPPSDESMEVLSRATSVSVPFHSDMAPATTDVSQTTDFEAQALIDASASMTPVDRTDAIRWSQRFEIQHYTNFMSQKFKIVGKSMMESVELVAQAAALQGQLVQRAAARSSLDAGTAAHNLSYSSFMAGASTLQDIQSPAYITPNGEKRWVAIMRNEPMTDLTLVNPILDIAKYQDKEIILNNEIGRIGNFKIVSSPWAKVFGAAGAANATAVSTTINSGALPLDKTFVTAADVSASVNAGRVWMVGPAAETGNTFQPLNEIIRPVSAVTTTITFVGSGSNGGFRFAHPVGHVVKNADPVYPVLFGYPATAKRHGSLQKIWSPSIGEFGEIRGPFKRGTNDLFTELGYYWYGAYGRMAEQYLYRVEVSSSLDA